jgi:hypothetical protein
MGKLKFPASLKSEQGRGREAVLKMLNALLPDQKQRKWLRKTALKKNFPRFPKRFRSIQLTLGLDNIRACFSHFTTTNVLTVFFISLDLEFCTEEEEDTSDIKDINQTGSTREKT